MSAIRINDIPLFQVDLPSMTLAQYNALPEADRPKHWIRTDLEYRNIPASMVDLSNGQTVEQAVNKGSVSVTADGVKTYGELLIELAALIDGSKISANSTAIVDGHILHPIVVSGNRMLASYSRVQAGAVTVYTVDVRSTPAYYSAAIGTTPTVTITNNISNVPASGATLQINY